jgi:hypothetical protein
MKTKLTFIALLTMLFSSFAYAEVVVEKIIAVNGGVVVERFYNHNKSYETVYTKKALNYKVCLLNPKHFKKCSDREFRTMSSKKTWYFPALPEAKNTETTKQIYQNNEIYRVLFASFTKFKLEVCKNNPAIYVNCNPKALRVISKDIGLKITQRPLTYLIHGEKSPSVTIEGKTFIKKIGGYYLLTQTSTKKLE